MLIFVVTIVALVCLKSTTVLSFSVPTTTTRTTTTTSISRVTTNNKQQQRQPFRPLSMALEEVDPQDPYESYELSEKQQDVAIKDVVVGTGQLVEGEGQLLTVKYTGSFMANKEQFDFSKDFVCRIGKNKILPGFEKGLMVCCHSNVSYKFWYLNCSLV